MGKDSSTVVCEDKAEENVVKKKPNKTNKSTCALE